MHVVECELPEDASMDEVQKATAFVQVAKMNGLVVIIRGIADWAKLLEADGVLLNHVEEIAAAKEALGEDKIIGLSCGVNRNLMSEALEQGVDYITLGSAPISPDVKLLTEWTTKTSAPVAVLGPLSNDNADIYAIAGATFLDITNYLTTLEKGPIQATVNMLHAIDLAFEGGMPN